MSLDGYIKDMNIVAIPKITGAWSLDHVIHNRLNYQWKISKSLILKLAARSRMYFGESVQNNPSFDEFITQNLDYFNLEDIIAREQSFLLHTIIDRANLSFIKGKWQVVLGKQRINWSQSYVWNPNDIFNAFSFFDFDYEERRGTDAALIAYEPTPLSSVQLASNIHSDWDSVAMAAFYRFNNWRYDFQALAGKYQTDIYAGIGWAGQLTTVGFSGELGFFQPYQTETDPTFVGDISFDYRFPNTLNFRLEGIFNSNPDSAASGPFFLQPVAAKTLIYNKWSAFLSADFEINPLIIVNVNGIWNIDDRSFFANPNVDFSLSENTNLLIALQVFGGGTGSLYKRLGSFLYTRLKFNF